MCTSRFHEGARSGLGGFTLLELVVAAALTVGLAMALSPLALTLQRAGLKEADRVIAVVQSRVAAARFEKDLRTASAAGCPFFAPGPVLEATPWQVVFLRQGGQESGCVLVEWEIDHSRLMRRWGPCPSCGPAEFAHSAYVDHKTMLDGLGADARLSYYVDGALVEGCLATERLPFVEGVVLRASAVDDHGQWQEGIWVGSGVGR